jgi:fucose 4-O-acetylase-like acetyltransferase
MIQENQSTDIGPVISRVAATVQRVGYVDIAKGIGIILVVMGHNDFALISPFAHKLIYSFHMPMFFFMSGMFFKPDLPIWGFLHNRFHRVLKPFLAILLLIYFASLSFSKVSMVMASRRLVKAMYGSGFYIDWVQLWFLPHLFAVSLFAYLFYKAVKRAHVMPVRWLILAGLYVAGILALRLFWPLKLSILGRQLTLFGLPYGMDMVLVSGFFFIAGYELNKRRNDVLFANLWTLVFSGGLLFFLVWYFPARIDFNTRQFDSLPINTLEALVGILFILALSRQLERVGLLASALRYVGQASLIILIFQVPIQDFWGQKLLALTNNLPFSYWVSFLAGVIGPILIGALLIRPNPIVREWFGQPAPKEKKQLGASVFE